MFDVGQAESMLIEMSNHAGGHGWQPSPEASGNLRLVVDTGGAPFGDSVDIGARVLVPALWDSGLRRLDRVLVTHGDPDHLGGAEVLIDEFRPPVLLEGIVVPGHAPMTAVRHTAIATGARVEVLHAGRTMTFGELRIRVLHPPAPDWERPRVRNDDSVVLEMTYRDIAILLTGDISRDVERTLLPQLTRAPTRILKVAHHGSRTSTASELLDSWHPQLALISAGRGNSFGHPTPEVLQRLASISATVLRTDRHGQITVETDGHTLRSRTFIGATR